MYFSITLMTQVALYIQSPLSAPPSQHHQRRSPYHMHEPPAASCRKRSRCDDTRPSRQAYRVPRRATTAARFRCSLSAVAARAGRTCTADGRCHVDGRPARLEGRPQSRRRLPGPGMRTRTWDESAGLRVFIVIREEIGTWRATWAW